MGVLANKQELANRLEDRAQRPDHLSGIDPSLMPWGRRLPCLPTDLASDLYTGEREEDGNGKETLWTPVLPAFGKDDLFDNVCGGGCR